MVNILVWLSISLVFVLGLIYYLRGSLSVLVNFKEGMGMMDSSKQKRMCGNLLVKEGNQIKLYNSNTAEVPGINPLVFNSLDEYGEFVDWLRSQNIHCPVLVLEESYNVQGDKTYVHGGDMRFLGAVSDDLIQVPYEGNGVPTIQPLIDATKDNNPPYNVYDHQGYDPQNQQIGRFTKLDLEPTDVIENGKSPFATDPNWGGPEYSQKLLDVGMFDEDKVYVKR
jgi:hypothetical protein